jgi:hypothetical protein
VNTVAETISRTMTAAKRRCFPQPIPWTGRRPKPFCHRPESPASQPRRWGGPPLDDDHPVGRSHCNRQQRHHAGDREHGGAWRRKLRLDSRISHWCRYGRRVTSASRSDYQSSTAAVSAYATPARADAITVASTDLHPLPGSSAAWRPDGRLRSSLDATDTEGVALRNVRTTYATA